MTKPTIKDIEMFFQGFSYAMSLLEDRPDCKTARAIQNKERMELRLMQEKAGLYERT